MAAASEYGSGYSASYGRLYGSRCNGWCALTSNSKSDWLQINSWETIQGCGVATQGDRNGNELVTAFKLSFSTDGNTLKTYRDEQNVEVGRGMMVFCVFCL